MFSEFSFTVISLFIDLYRDFVYKYLYKFEVADVITNVSYNYSRYSWLILLIVPYCHERCLKMLKNFNFKWNMCVDMFLQFAIFVDIYYKIMPQIMPFCRIPAMMSMKWLSLYLLSVSLGSSWNVSRWSFI